MPAPFTHSHNAFRRLLGMPRGRASRLAAAMAVVVIGGCGGVSTLAPGGQQDHSAATTPPVPGAGTRAVVPSTPAPAEASPAPASTVHSASRVPALAALATLPVKGRAAKTGYERELFGQAWSDVDRNGCDTRNDVLRRDLTGYVLKAGTRGCVVVRGTLRDPYTGRTIAFIRGEGTSALVQVDHVVALSDAWQKGAQRLSYERRTALANDPLNLLAVDGPTNQRKGDGDAATWLPPQHAYRCAYVARQVAVKARHGLWVTAAERDAIAQVLRSCPSQRLPTRAAIPLGGGTVEAAAPAPAPLPSTAATAAPREAATDPRFGSCREAKAAGFGPYESGRDPEYAWYRDGDGDGEVCE